jgi:hypothetical protein
MISVMISFVNGGQRDFGAQDDEFYERLEALRVAECGGKIIIDILFSDQWETTPRGMRISGTLGNGNLVDEYVSYR